jgi:hypothetical protein
MVHGCSTVSCRGMMVQLSFPEGSSVMRRVGLASMRTVGDARAVWSKVAGGLKGICNDMVLRLMRQIPQYVNASSMKSTQPSVKCGRTACLTASAIPPDAQTVTAIAPTRCLTSSSIKLA